MAIKKASSLFANTGKGAIAVAEVENTAAYDSREFGDKAEEDVSPSTATVGKVTARIPTSLPYSYIEAEITGEGAVELAAQLIERYGSVEPPHKQVARVLANRALDNAEGSNETLGETIMFNGAPVTIPEEYVEELEGAILKDNRGTPVSKNGKKIPSFVFTNGVNQLAGFINTTDFKGNKLATPKLSWGKLQPAYQPRG